MLQDQPNFWFLLRTKGIQFVEIDKCTLPILQMGDPCAQTFPVQMAPPWDFLIVEKFSLS
jgi:hypothetical protein